MSGKMITKDQIEMLSADHLWSLYNEVRSALTRRLRLQMREIDDRLKALANAEPIKRPVAEKTGARNSSRKATVKRKYPKVLPQYRNPNDPSQTWAGRGLRPKWLVLQLKAGKKIEDFRISPLARKAA